MMRISIVRFHRDCICINTHYLIEAAITQYWVKPFRWFQIIVLW